MYICRHCGLEYKTDEAVLCPRCQAPKGKGGNFCPFCGVQVTPEQKICTNCGVEMDMYGIHGVKSKIAAGLLGIFFGVYGIHNFYLGYYKKAAVQLGLVLFSYIMYGGVLFVSMTFSDALLSDTGIIAFLIAAVVFALLRFGVRIWAFVEAVLIFCGKIKKDGKGRMLK